MVRTSVALTWGLNDFKHNRGRLNATTHFDKKSKAKKVYVLILSILYICLLNALFCFVKSIFSRLPKRKSSWFHNVVAHIIDAHI